MLSGTGATSLRKQDSTDQKNIGTGFIKTVFRHQCSGGETGINLNALTMPPQMAARGLTNPSGAQLAALNLTTYANNLRLASSARTGTLMRGLAFDVSATGNQINFIGFTALPGEIFEGTVDYTAVNGIQVVSATGQPATGTLAAGTTDFNIGYPVPTNQYSTTNLGGVLVYLDGVLQTRNTGNSSTVTDGNYYEVDNGSGNFSVIRFNLADPSQTRNVLVVPNGLLVPQPDGSLLTTVQTMAGQINQLSQFVASLTGLSQSAVLGGAASYTDLLAFGNLVNAINSNYANKNGNNTWTAAQPLVGITDGSSAPAGQIGEVIRSTVPVSSEVGLPTNGTVTNITSITVTPGDWEISGNIAFDCAASSAAWTVIQSGISRTSATLPTNANGLGQSSGNGEFSHLIRWGASTNMNEVVTPIPSYRFTTSTSVTLYLVAATTVQTSSFSGFGYIEARRMR